MANPSSTLSNVLGRETSPYLKQHQDNPVAWQPWSDETFARARAENKPVLLSIGYAACHWCHVMAHESFESPEIAELMNELFINVKVDREERPDVDNIYQSALALLGEHGGWPLTMFLTPDGEPFWGGTYFPNVPRFGRPTFTEVLKAMSKTFHDQKETVAKNSTAIKNALTKLSTAPKGQALTLERMDDVAKTAIRMIDPFHGGTMGAPKFPQPSFFAFVWNAFIRSKSPLFRDAVTVTLDRMCDGGIYDHLGGGFARYSTDEVWLAPHFEKMLYDNALLIDLMTDVWKETRSERYRQRIDETIVWLKREMLSDQDGEAAFASALDADSEGEEGKFYVWSEAEIDQVLGETSPIFKEYYDVSEFGNWEGHNILRLTNAPEGDNPAIAESLKTARDRLLAVRAGRIRPERDHKVLADWNGMMIAALVHAAEVFDRPDWMDLALSSYRFIKAQMRDGERLFHTWCDGQPKHPGVLDDYATLARAALRLYEVTNDGGYLADAEAWMVTVEAHFKDPEGGYFMAADDTADIFTRSKAFADNAVPSGNGLVAEVYAKLYLLTGKANYLDRAQDQCAVFASDQLEQLINMPTLLSAFDLVTRARQLVIVGQADDPDRDALWRAALETSGPQGSMIKIDPDTPLPPEHPANGKGLVDGRATAYLCEGGTCGLPMTDVQALRDSLQAV